MSEFKINDFDFDDIKIGLTHKFNKNLSIDDIDSYAKLVGDFNPLHLDEKFASTSIFESRICHGMLGASLFSTMVGMFCPGKNSLYLSQTINFRKPIYPDKELTIKSTVLSKSESLRIIELETQIIDGKVLLVDGIAKVRLI